MKDETETGCREEKRRLERTNKEMKRQLREAEEELEELQHELEKQQIMQRERHKNYQHLVASKEEITQRHRGHRKDNEAAIEKLETELLSLRGEVAALRQQQEQEEEKTKRNNKAQTLNEIWGMLKRHRETYEAGQD